MPLPLTNIDKVVAMRPELRQLFEGGKKIVGFQPMPTTPQPRVLVLRGLKEQVVYPMWNNIDDIMRVNGKEYARFEGVIILGGIGLGYLAEAIASKIGPFCTLAIWEPDPEWIRVACYFRKNDDLFANRQVQLLIGGEQVLRTYIDMTYQRLSLGIQTVVDSCLGDMYPERREMMDVTIPAIMKTYEGNRSTLIAFGELFFKNAVRSLEFMADSYSVKTLKGTAQGIPAIVVGAGPGLKGQYRNLKRLKRRPASCIIFSADTALSPLLAHGIVPDFVFSVDPQPETGVKYKNLQIPKECALIFHPGACSEIAKTFPHLKFYVPSPITPLDQFESIFGKSEGIGAKMQCQVHLACDVATYMGCTPIMLIGIDLCYYSPQELYAELPSYLEGLEQEHFDKAVPEKDMNGDEVFVTSQFDQYRSGFAERAKTTRILNGNDRGLIIPGVKKKTLSAFISEETGMRLIDMVGMKQKIICAPQSDPVEYTLRTKIRSICKELRFYQLIATQVNKYVEKGDGLETRDLLNRWCWKVCRRKEGLIVLVLLERYGHMWPEPIRRIRMPVLADQLASVTEWVRMAEYYNWLLRATTLALYEFEVVYANLARTRVPKVRALVSVSDGTDPE